MSIRIAYAGNRDISVKILRFIIEKGIKPLALMRVDEHSSPVPKELIRLCDYLETSRIADGRDFAHDKFINPLKELNLDYIICIHFPYIIPPRILEIPKHGVINLHPAYLPYNRGWHTPTWAIHDENPYGATLHFMDDDVDTGDIIHQKEIKILPEDTANSLYQRVLELEFEVFKEAWPLLVSGTYVRKSQLKNAGTVHKKRDIKQIQHINLEENVKAGDLIKRLRALTTNDIKEATYFKIGEKKYRIQISIQEEKGRY